MKKTIITGSEAETMSLASGLAAELRRGRVITLRGELGSGKTVFARGIAAGLDINEVITSPTFSLLEIYEDTLPLYHFDLYRVETESELLQIGFDEYINGEGICIIEWPEIAESFIPPDRIGILIEYIDENRRRIIIEHPDV